MAHSLLIEWPVSAEGVERNDSWALWRPPAQICRKSFGRVSALTVLIFFMSCIISDINAHCAAGTFSVAGSTSCVQCPAGQNSGPGATACYSWAPSCSAGSVASPHLPLTTDLSATGQASLLTIFAAYLANPSYTGPVFNLLRSSDGATADFFADAMGNLGTGAAATGTSVVDWLGTSTAYVTTWYDQSGLGKHATQINSGEQPTFNAGGQFVDLSGGTFLNMQPSSMPLSNGVYSFTVKHGSIGSAEPAGVFSFGQSSHFEWSTLLVWGAQYYDNSWYNFDANFGTGLVTVGNVVSVTYDQSNVVSYVNNNLEGSTQASGQLNQDNTPAYLGKCTISPGYMDGQLYSLVTSNVVLSAGDRSLLEGCTECPIGTYQSGASCLQCPAGFYSSAPAATSCSPCPKGTASTVVGATSLSACASCSPGTYSETGATSCARPPAPGGLPSGSHPAYIWISPGSHITCNEACQNIGTTCSASGYRQLTNEATFSAIAETTYKTNNCDYFDDGGRNTPFPHSIENVTKYCPYIHPCTSITQDDHTGLYTQQDDDSFVYGCYFSWQSSCSVATPFGQAGYSQICPCVNNMPTFSPTPRPSPQRDARNEHGFPIGVQTRFNAFGTLLKTGGYEYVCHPCYWDESHYFMDMGVNGAVYAATYGTMMNSTTINTNYGCMTESPDIWTFLGAFTNDVSNYQSSSAPDETCVWPCILVGAFGQSNVIFTPTNGSHTTLNNYVNWYFGNDGGYDIPSMGFAHRESGIDIITGYDTCGTLYDFAETSVCGSAVFNYYRDYRLSWAINTDHIAGVRAGAVENLFFSSQFYKMAYQCTYAPTSQPSAQPSSQPSKQPSAQPSVDPSSQPTSQPSSLPSSQPSSKPTVQPSIQPSAIPTGQPSDQPSSRPTSIPTYQGAFNPQQYVAYNHYAFAVVTPAGNVITWGDAKSGGNSSSVASKLRGVKKIIESETAFCAIRSSGDIVVWGTVTRIPNIPPPRGLSGIVSGIANDKAFALFDGAGKVYTFGKATYGGLLSIETSLTRSLLSSGVVKIFSNSMAFVAVKGDGTIVSWGSSIAGGGVSTVTSPHLDRVVRVFSTRLAFATINHWHHLYSWGHPQYGGGGFNITSENIQYVAATSTAFAALTLEGRVGYHWGTDDDGGNSYLQVKQYLHNISFIYTTDTAFAALKEDGSIVVWGDTEGGGLYDERVKSIPKTAVRLYSNGGAFAVTTTTGAVYTWGDTDFGGVINDPKVAANLTSGVYNIHSTWNAFAALKSDGTLFIWGNTYRFTHTHGHSVTVSTGFPEGGLADVNRVCSNRAAFIALRTSGPPVTFGHGLFGGNSLSVEKALNAANLTSC